MMIKPVKKIQIDEPSSWIGNALDLLRLVGSLDEYKRELLKDETYRDTVNKRLSLIHKNMERQEEIRLESQEQALLEQAESERKRREQLGGLNE
ncbi:hypothetical protein AB4538_06620 [Vibrio lentus]